MATKGMPQKYAFIYIGDKGQAVTFPFVKWDPATFAEIDFDNLTDANNKVNMYFLNQDDNTLFVIEGTVNSDKEVVVLFKSTDFIKNNVKKPGKYYYFGRPKYAATEAFPDGRELTAHYPLSDPEYLEVLIRPDDIYTAN